MDFIYQYTCIPMIPHGSPLHSLVSPLFPILFFYFFDVPHGSPLHCLVTPWIPILFFYFFDVPHGTVTKTLQKLKLSFWVQFIVLTLSKAILMGFCSKLYSFVKIGIFLNHSKLFFPLNTVFVVFLLIEIADFVLFKPMWLLMGNFNSSKIRFK